MTVFNKVTLASLKRNKTRTLVTIIGIALAAAMICAVTTIAATALNYLKKNYEYADGTWHGAELETDRATLDMIASADEVDTTVYNTYIGYAIAEGCTNPNKPYLYIIGASRDFESIMPVHITSGNYPKNDSEILLPDHLLDNGNVSHKIGDVLVLDVGDRVLDGYKLNQNNPYLASEGEELSVRETKEFTVVGFYVRPGFENYSAPGYTAITVSDDSANGVYDVYFTMKEAKNIYSFLDKNGIGDTTNRDVLLFSGVSEFESFHTIIYGLAAIIITLIMFGAVALIYNAFSISVSERTKQFGLLSSIGATKKQLRGMVFFEALAVSVIGIPIGILVGIGGIWVTITLLGDKFASLAAYPIPVTLAVPPLTVIIAALVALLTVLISAWIPSRRATRISAVEAIRQSKDIKVENKKVKTSKLTYSLFGLPGVLATKHFKRNRKKYRATVVSLFMSIVLFISASSFSEYLMKSVESAFSTYGYDIEYIDFTKGAATRTPDQLLADLRNAEAVTKGTYITRQKLYGNVNSSILNSDWIENAAGASIYLEGLEESKTHTVINLTFVEDETYRSYLEENKLDADIYFDPESPAAVAIDGRTVFDRSEEKFNVINMLKDGTAEIKAEYAKDFDDAFIDSVTTQNGEKVCKLYSYRDDEETILPYSEVFTERTHKIGKIVYERPYFLDDDIYLTLLYPESLKEKVLPDTEFSEYTYLFVSDDHSASFADMEDMLADYGMGTSHLYDYAATVERSRDLITVIEVFAYGFIVLISLISAANVFNTISTNIALRRREFAMLKSVGMSKKDINKMMNFECLLYGAKALLFGLPVALVINYLVYRVVSDGLTIGFTIPWAAIAIAVFSVFAVVFVTMIYSMQKIKKENPIDALKNENI